jgi:hypothetical protein
MDPAFSREWAERENIDLGDMRGAAFDAWLELSGDVRREAGKQRMR